MATKKHSAMARLWADNVFAGKRSFKEVPAKLANEVKENLIEKGYVFEEETDDKSTEDSDKDSSEVTDKNE